VGELFSSPGPPVRSGSPPLLPSSVYFLGPCFNSWLSNYQWWSECVRPKHDFMFFQFCIFLRKHSTWWIDDRKNVKFEWLINYRITIAKAANLLGPGTWLPAVKSNNFAAAERSRLKFPVPGTTFRLTLTAAHNRYRKYHPVHHRMHAPGTGTPSNVYFRVQSAPCEPVAPVSCVQSFART